MRNRVHLPLCIVAFGALSLTPTQARPLEPAEERIIPYSAKLPLCDTPSVLDTLASRFAAKESEYWHSSLQIVSYDRIGQSGFRTNGRDYIPRRYCSARALFNDGRRRWAVYSIGEDLGIIGFGFGLADYSFGLDWCVGGLDRGWAYGPGCEALKPIVGRVRRGEFARYKQSPVTSVAPTRMQVAPIKPLPAPALPPLSNGAAPPPLKPPIPAPTP
jgi:hypothetical protein